MTTDTESTARARTSRRISEFTDEELLAAYQRHGNVWRAGEELGVRGQSLHRRLKRRGWNVSHPVEFTENQQATIRATYAAGFLKGDGTLESLATLLGKTKHNVCRWARRNGLTNPGRTVTPEMAAEMGKRQKKRIQEHGHPRGFLGGKHTPESLEKMAAAAVRFQEQMTPEVRADINLRTQKTKAAKGTLYQPRSKASWKADWREIGGVRKYYRSRWEANYARYLEFLKSQGQIAAWSHEPETFWFDKIKRGTCSYLPDFKVTRNDGTIYYVEVKGWMDARSKTKLKRMKKYHPNVEVELVEGKQYAKLEKSIASVIPDWEAKTPKVKREARLAV